MTIKNIKKSFFKDLFDKDESPLLHKIFKYCSQCIKNDMYVKEF